MGQKSFLTHPLVLKASTQVALPRGLVVKINLLILQCIRI